MTHLTTLDALKQNITLLASVEESDVLMSRGGVGCPLRYRHDSRKDEPDGLAQV